MSADLAAAVDRAWEDRAHVSPASTEVRAVVEQAIELLARYPQLAGVITHVIDAEDVVEAFQTARNSQESGKVVVSLWLDED